MRLSRRLESFFKEKQFGLIVDEDQTEALARKAVRFYAGFAHLTHYRDSGLSHEDDSVDSDTLITESEWAFISPLMMLYIELENATALEATRGLGADVYGRATSEIQGDITQLEQEMPLKAFSMEAVTV